MDRNVLDVKIESLSRCIGRIESKQPFTLDELAVNYDLQDIISINLERAVQNAVDIASILLAELGVPAPQTMAEAFEKLKEAKILTKNTSERMKKSVGFRNLLVHEYTRVDWAIVHSISTKHLKDFRKFIREIDNNLPKMK